MSTPTATRPRSIGIALIVVVIYILFAAGLGNLIDGLAAADDEVAQFALGHLIPLPIAIVFLLLFLRWSGWGADVWRERPTSTHASRRWWLVAIPVLAVVQVVAQLGDVPWTDITLGFIALIALGTLMVGFGEELAIRGVLLIAVRARHGELATLVITTAVFAAAHIPGYLVGGLPAAGIAFALFALSITGATYYWIRRVTGRLWVGMLIHAATDWVLYLGAAETPTAPLSADHSAGGDTIASITQSLIIILLFAGLISVIRQDRRTKHLRTKDQSSTPLAR